MPLVIRWINLHLCASARAHVSRISLTNWPRDLLSALLSASSRSTTHRGVSWRTSTICVSLLRARLKAGLEAMSNQEWAEQAVQQMLVRVRRMCVAELLRRAAELRK